MDQNLPRITPEAATDEPASPRNENDGCSSPPPERDSYFSQSPGEDEAPPREKVTVPLPPREQATAPLPPPEQAADPSPTGFDAVPLRYRRDGLTPQRQREFVEALADTGVAREAAARIGVSEQAINRVRRRADARAFDLACEAAQRLGARRLRSIAYQRAIEGTVKRHHYHGEVRSEEVVYDNRLLMFLLGKADKWLEPPPEAAAVLADWEPWLDAVEQGLAAPPSAGPAPAAAAEDEDEDGFTGAELWQDEDAIWWTEFPPGADFDGEEHGEPGDADYRRTLSAAELAVAEADAREEREEELERQRARRDAWFGFSGGRPDRDEDDEDDADDEDDEDADDEDDEDDEDGEDGEEDGPDETEAGAEDRSPEAAAGSAAAAATRAAAGLFPSREAETTETSAPSRRGRRRRRRRGR